MATTHGHGHVIPNPDGTRARCGGRALCGVCQEEARLGRWLTDEEEKAILAERQRPKPPPASVDPCFICGRHDLPPGAEARIEEHLRREREGPGPHWKPDDYRLKLWEDEAAALYPLPELRVHRRCYPEFLARARRLLGSVLAVQ